MYHIIIRFGKMRLRNYGNCPFEYLYIINNYTKRYRSVSLLLCDSVAVSSGRM